MTFLVSGSLRQIDLHKVKLLNFLADYHPLDFFGYPGIAVNLPIYRRKRRREPLASRAIF
jgi:hypothetical protein